MTKPGNVIEALAQVSSRIGVIAKDKTTKATGNYKYRGIDAVLNALHGPLHEAGVVIVPRVGKAEMVERGNQSEAQMLIEYRIYGPGGPGDYIDTSVFATGLDSGDKATGKAMSYAYKSMAFQLFCIPTDASVDNEAENVVREARTAQRQPEVEEWDEARWTVLADSLRLLEKDDRDAAIKLLADAGLFTGRTPNKPFTDRQLDNVQSILDSCTPEAVTPPAHRPQHAIDTLVDARGCDPLTAEGIEGWMWELASYANADEIPWKSYAGKDHTCLRQQAILDKARELASDLTAKGVTTDSPDRLDDIHGELAVALRLALLAYDPSKPF
jgi:hypothetical protein